MELVIKSVSEIPANKVSDMSLPASGFDDPTNPLCGLPAGAFRHLSDIDKVLLLRLISQCCEKSFRRGFCQGWDTRERGDKVCDLEMWRFAADLDVSVSPHGTYHCTSLERLKIQCHLYQVGLPRMEVSCLTEKQIEQTIGWLFPSQRKKSGVKKSVRFAVLRRDGFRCVYCGATAAERKLHVDHVYPRSHGGSDEMENLVASCDECNIGKSNRHTDLAMEAKDGTDAG